MTQFCAKCLFSIVILVLVLSIKCSNNSNGEVRRVIIDVDAGADDAWAIVFLLSSEEKYKFKVEAITCTHGNTEVDNVAVNVLRTLTAINRTDIPIYKGANERIITPAPPKDPSNFFYGVDGWSDLDNSDEKIDKSLIKDKHAVNYLKKMISDSPNQITILCVGPLTNVALLLKMYPKTRSEIKEIFIMGGNRYGSYFQFILPSNNENQFCIEGIGNVPNSASEFNFYNDPEGANVVINNYKGKITVLPWETNLKSNLIFPKAWRFDVLGKDEGVEIVKVLNKVELKAYVEYTDWMPCDAMLAVLFAFPEIITESKVYSGDVELTGRLTRGQLVLDHMNEGKGNIVIVDNLNEDTFKELMLFSVGA